MLNDMSHDDLPAMDEVNLAAWRADDIVRHYAAASGWLDVGEDLAVTDALHARPNAAFLDIGVGGGRTTGLLHKQTADYVGIDISDKMIAACRARFPGVKLRQEDARRMDSLRDESFDIALFSCAGLDAMDAAGRQAILGEVRRVLRPGGLFVFSSFNNDGPWAQSRVGAFMPRRWRDLRTLAGNIRRSLRDISGAEGRLQRLTPHERRGRERSLRLLPAFGFRVLALFSSCAVIADELERCGFAPGMVLTDRGQAVSDPAKPPPYASWFYYTAQKQ